MPRARRKKSVITDSAIDISGLSKAQLLAALYNAASSAGKGFIRAASSPSGDMTVRQAAEHLRRQTSFDWLNGRSFKVDLGSDSFEPWLYDRDNGGEGTAEKIIERLRATGAVSSNDIEQNRESMTTQHAYESPVDAELGAVMENVNAKWQEIVADGIPQPRPGMTPRQHLDWTSDLALAYYDRGEPDKAILLFLSVIAEHPETAWIATHPMTGMMLLMGVRDGRGQLEYMMKGFAA
jgi:hypothetical protein